MRAKQECGACGSKEDLFHSHGVYDYYICRLCDRMPRGQVLMAAYLRDIDFTIRLLLEWTMAEHEEAAERAGRLSVADLEDVWRRDEREDS